MQLTKPTTQELAAFETGLFFGQTTNPTADQASEIIDESYSEVVRIYLQIGLDPAEWDPTDHPELNEWHKRVVLYRAMTEVWDRQRRQGENPYRKRFERERGLALRAPSAVGIPLSDPDDEDEWAQGPTNSVSRIGKTDQVLGGVYDHYLRNSGGF